MTVHDPHDVVKLTDTGTSVEAHVVEQALLSEGITSRVVGDYLNAGIGDIPGLGAEVWVHRDDLAAAEAVLNSASERRAATAASPEESETGA